MGFDGVIGMREVDDHLLDGAEIADELDRIVKSGKQLADVFYTNLPEIPPKPDEYDPGVQLSDERMVKYFGWYFLTGYFPREVKGNIRESAQKLMQDFGRWKSLIIHDDSSTLKNKQLAKNLSVDLLVDVANDEIGKAYRILRDESIREERINFWTEVREVTQIAAAVST